MKGNLYVYKTNGYGYHLQADVFIDDYETFHVDGLTYPFLSLARAMAAYREDTNTKGVRFKIIKM